MTNLIAILSITVSTNWTQIEFRNNQCGQAGCLVIHYDQVKEVGIVTTNWFANIVFEGKTNTVLLKSQSEEWPSQKRERAVSLFGNSFNATVERYGGKITPNLENK